MEPHMKIRQNSCGVFFLGGNPQEVSGYRSSAHCPAWLVIYNATPVLARELDAQWPTQILLWPYGPLKYTCVLVVSPSPAV